MNQAKRKLSGLLVLPVLLAALLMTPVGAKAEEAPYECFAELPVGVELNGEKEEQFHVTIDCGEGQPMPEEAEEGLWVAGDGRDAFHNFHFTEPGDYKYTVTQECGETEYMTYDDVVYTVTIRVTNAADGGLQSEIWATTDDDPATKGEELSFLNTYAPPAPTPAATPVDEHPDIAEGIENGTWGGAPSATPDPATGVIPQTSDSLPLTALIVVLAVAAAAIVVLVVLRKRGRKQDGPQE